MARANIVEIEKNITAKKKVLDDKVKEYGDYVTKLINQLNDLTAKQKASDLTDAQKNTLAEKVKLVQEKLDKAQKRLKEAQENITKNR